MKLPGIGQDVNAPTIADLRGNLPFIGPMPNIPVPGTTGVPIPGFPTPYQQYRDRMDRERRSQDFFGNPTTGYYSPTSFNRTTQGTTVVQLVVDKRVLGEIAIDALGNVAQFQGGLHPGSVAGA